MQRKDEILCFSNLRLLFPMYWDQKNTQSRCSKGRRSVGVAQFIPANESVSYPPNDFWYRHFSVRYDIFRNVHMRLLRQCFYAPPPNTCGFRPGVREGQDTSALYLIHRAYMAFKKHWTVVETSAKAQLCLNHMSVCVMSVTNSSK